MEAEVGSDLRVRGQEEERDELTAAEKEKEGEKKFQA